MPFASRNLIDWRAWLVSANPCMSCDRGLGLRLDYPEALAIISAHDAMK
jgi:hypothetical protein